ncbi:NAD kinase [Saccharibacter sp. 17.LH.SD]|uniref:NAD kinase n=1 Tax=Saccharibacter sp. 17.LH.SD TaxID=2689393 RepID=UPI00137005B1|nr:NAD kinase [Saccharibacter sp. 17.LH.SD]MXV44878.1 NAD kinase [Saccharibacter sp. 17.LH.SD]
MNIAFIAADTDSAQQALERFTERYGNVPLDQAEVIVCLGGDGFLLETLLHILGYNIPVFGMNYGTVGFLMNEPEEEHLPQRLAYAQPTIISPLRMRVRTTSGEYHEGLGFNDVFIYRETRQAAHIGIEVDGRERMARLVCDGIILSTPAGSTAYNRSAHGPIVPLGAELLSLTPISPFQPRHWRGALLPAESMVRFTLHDTVKRPASAVAGPAEIRDAKEVVVGVDQEKKVTLLFDPDHSLSERIIAEQFAE